MVYLPDLIGMASDASAICVSSDSEDDQDGEEIPPRDECERRCQTFADVTGTDTALAMFYLQERSWDLESSINDFFQQDTGATSSSGSAASDAKSNQAQRNQRNPATGTQLTIAPPVHQNEHSNTIKVLSWNIDGLDPDNLQSRTEGACSVLLQEKPEVIFLQEVVERSLAIIKSRCSQYHVYIGAEGDGITPLYCNAYFTAMLLRKDCVRVESVNKADFPGSLMTRNLLEIQATVQEVPMALLTSHLESTAEHSNERKKQLKIAFDRMTALADDRTVVFGGDLNLREKELAGSTSKPSNIYDVWECTGKRPEAKHTWDLMRNDNKDLGGKFKPRCRFDRIYIRHSKPAKLKPVYFELVGIQRLASCQRFPSDHWGILSHYNILGAT